MRLVSFSVERYRSITKAEKIKLGNKVILVGPNNEGKSNMLRALVTAMNILTLGRARIGLRQRRYMIMFSRRYYNWNTDFPIHLQESKPDGESVMILEFELTKDELDDFYKEINSRLTGNLPIRISIGQENVTVKVFKKGRGAKSLSAKSDRIAAFVSERLIFEHIVAVRTAQSVQRIVDEMVQRELSNVEGNSEFVEALKKIAEIQQPTLDRISDSIKKTLLKFLPDIKDVNVTISSEERYKALRSSCEIIIDDGTPTLLKYKGDGVQSLAALGIMQHSSESGARGKNFVIAIEEPESHLHPHAIHELRDVIDELSKKYQIVLTTHCPLFVDRLNISNNIVVNKNKARPAKKVQEVRDILGVRASDNLRNAELVLLVEGQDDMVSLKSLLAYHSQELKAALDNGTLAIDFLGGGTNLAYKIGLFRDSLCLTHCFLDDDKAGNDSFEKARLQGLIPYGNTNFSTCEGMKEAEIEDLYDPELYKDMIYNIYRVRLDSGKFKTNKKWSERMKDTFKHHGKRWNDQIENELKTKISQLVSEYPEKTLNPKKQTSFDSLVRNLEDRLDELSSSR